MILQIYLIYVSARTHEQCLCGRFVKSKRYATPAALGLGAHAAPAARRRRRCRRRVSSRYDISMINDPTRDRRSQMANHSVLSVALLILGGESYLFSTLTTNGLTLASLSDRHPLLIYALMKHASVTRELRYYWKTVSNNVMFLIAFSRGKQTWRATRNQVTSGLPISGVEIEHLMEIGTGYGRGWSGEGGNGVMDGDSRVMGQRNSHSLDETQQRRQYFMSVLRSVRVWYFISRIDPNFLPKLTTTQLYHFLSFDGQTFGRSLTALHDAYDRRSDPLPRDT
ncbi:hypothetical protein EVAR_85252_1 [Eumeta japonica]|uniref:Uncharacterized protein n=1 Tax=Eumeta variegata TaxID=151549 RepID=A0A4C1VYI5_EUMVA|nr:hypothetical protein EVAR_85252_1 [Eumeta japonica]